MFVEIDAQIMSLPALKDQDVVLFGTSAIIRYFFHKAGKKLDEKATELLFSEEQVIMKLLLENNFSGKCFLPDIPACFATQERKPFIIEQQSRVMMTPIPLITTVYVVNQLFLL